MPNINFIDVLWKKQKECVEKLPTVWSRFRSFENVFNYFESGQTVAQIACGDINDDLFLTMEKVGKNGKIILIDKKPDFIYNRLLKIVGNENLPKEKDFYVETKEGKKQLQKTLSTANIEAYVQCLPPYPKQIPDESLDHVMAINAAAELMARYPNRPPPDIISIVVETHKKLKNGGSFIVQGIVGGDANGFASYVYRAVKEKNLNFIQEYEMEFPPLIDWHAGEWKRWVKEG